MSALKRATLETLDKFNKSSVVVFFFLFVCIVFETFV